MHQPLRGKTVAVTGASRGLGKAIAERAAQEGANLILISRNEGKLAALKTEIENFYHVRAEYVALDVGKRDQIEEAFSRPPLRDAEIDVLVNNAGFGLFKSFEETPLEIAEAMFSVNVLGMMAMTKPVISKMKARGGGHIINIASQAGKISTPKSSVYSATKKAVLGFSDSLRMELAPYSIHVTTVNPGPIATGFFDFADESGEYLEKVGRWVLKPEEVAERIVKSMVKPVREINLPSLMNAGAKLYNLFPGLSEKLARPLFDKK
jgi:short chain dehydrogenase.